MEQPQTRSRTRGQSRRAVVQLAVDGFRTSVGDLVHEAESEVVGA